MNRQRGIDAGDARVCTCAGECMMKPIRVALSGSGFRLGAQLGALQAISDAGFEIVQIAGASGGSIVAALFASGMSLAACAICA